MNLISIIGSLEFLGSLQIQRAGHYHTHAKGSIPSRRDTADKIISLYTSKINIGTFTITYGTYKQE